MYILKNAWRNVTRNKGRNILIGIIILVIASSSCVALAIMNTSKTLIDSYANKYDVEASIGIDRKNMMKDFDPSSNDKDDLIDNFQEVNKVTAEEVKKYADSSYVSSYYYTYSVGLDGSNIDPATTQKDNQDSTHKQMGGGPNVTSTDFRLVGYSSLEAMNEFIEGKYSITDGEVSKEDNTCVINEELATLNNIKAGDTIKLTDDANNTYKLTVTGLFAEKEETNSMSMFSNSANNIITTSNTVSSIITKNNELEGTITPTFILTNKDVIDDFEEELYSKGMNENLNVTTNLDTIENSTSTISNVKSFATTFLIVVLIIGGIVLLVINAINIRERKYEIGVLRTIGMKKSSLAIQFMIELMIVSFASLIIGAAIGSSISVPISNKLLSSEIESSSEEINNIGKNFGGMANDNKDFSKINGINTVSEFTSIDAAVDIKVLAEVLTIGLCLTMLSSAASISAIQKFSPLTILKERS